MMMIMLLQSVIKSAENLVKTVERLVPEFFAAGCCYHKIQCEMAIEFEDIVTEFFKDYTAWRVCDNFAEELFLKREMEGLYKVCC